MTIDVFRRALWQRILTEPGWSTARFDGVCGRCATMYQAGTPIRRMMNGWMAACCAPYDDEMEYG